MNRNATWPTKKGGHKGRTHLKKELRTPDSKLFGEKQKTSSPRRFQWSSYRQRETHKTERVALEALSPLYVGVAGRPKKDSLGVSKIQVAGRGG